MKDIPWIHTMVVLALIINASPCFANADTRNEESSYIPFVQDVQYRDLIREVRKVEAPQEMVQPPVAQAKFTVKVDTNL